MSHFSIKNQVRFITAASLFDGHDAAIHVIRRILQSEGAEVIHLGHNRSVQEVVDAAIQEDVQGIAVSSYQGGHVEYFTYMLELLKKAGASHIKVFGGGGGVIVPEEIALLHSRGVTRIFSPEDGLKMGLIGMMRFMIEQCDFPPCKPVAHLPKTFTDQAIAQVISTLELDEAKTLRADIAKQKETQKPCPIIGITGTGGAGKSSLIDELLLRFLQTFPDKRIAVLSIDPTRKRTGGALLGDRIRFNSTRNPRVFVRSMATRRAHMAVSVHVKEALDVLSLANFDAVILETAGIGQSDSEVAELTDISVYVMTPEYGAGTQLEKIAMLDYADFVVINKFDKRGALDALRDVRKQYQRNHQFFDRDVSTMPIFGTSAHRFNDPGTNSFFNALFSKLWQFKKLQEGDPETAGLLPPSRTRYLSDIVETVRHHHVFAKQQAQIADNAQACSRIFEMVNNSPDLSKELHKNYDAFIENLDKDVKKSLDNFDQHIQEFISPMSVYHVRNKEIKVDNFTQSLSHQPIPKVAVPHYNSWGDRVRFSLLENFPGQFPYTAGVFPFKRQNEDPTRMFAGEGPPERTNKRFHYLSKGQPATRLSTAFDSVTLYGADPALRPDIYGKIGNSGVSVCSLDDAKRLYSGFNLCAPSTSVSMTINGPAPTILAFFFNAAIDAECEKRLKENGEWPNIETKIQNWFKEHKIKRPIYRADDLPQGHDGNGLGFLGLPASLIVKPDFYQEVKNYVLQNVRGTVQADILKEDQAQNTCIFSTEYAMRMMGDVQQYFNQHHIRNFYSVSISGYHIAEAGANPISQLAFTLSNGFTIVEYYRARGMDINEFAPNLSFFFSNGLDAEYSVIGRVARRIWAIAMRNLYGADERSQKLKYHIQTSGRSLHAQEISFNDIRTTLQALYAIADNCNSLHTNAYDEAVTTPTEDSVRRAVAIQLIINRELGLMKNENPLQGSFFIEYLTDLVEEAVLKEFEALDARGGVLGAMETMYQRSKIQEESLYYEHQKHSGELPIIGVNTYLSQSNEPQQKVYELIRSTDEEKRIQVEQVESLKTQFNELQLTALKQLKTVAQSGGNIFEELMETSKFCTLGMISDALYDVGGAYRRNM